MRYFCSLTRNIVVKPKLSPRLVFRTFTSTTPHNKYQIPKSKKDNIMSTTTTLKGQPLDRQVLDSMLRRRMFYTPSFEIYNGVAGLVGNDSFIQHLQYPKPYESFMSQPFHILIQILFSTYHERLFQRQLLTST